MRPKPILIFLSILFSSSIFSQNNLDKTIYFDSIWAETNEKNSHYYRIVKDYYTEKDVYKIYDYYKSGVIQMEGASKTKDYLSYEGEFIYYYENGNKKSKSHYTKSKLLGPHEEWYENGVKKLEGEYLKSEERITNTLKINQFWNRDNTQTVKNGQGFYQEIETNFSESGNIKDGLRDGIWKGEYDKHKRKYVEKYKKGRLISGKSTDEENNNYEYTELETPPKPKNGIQDFYKYLSVNFTIPKGHENTKGKILTQFIVEKDGKIVETKTIKSLAPELDQESIIVIRSYENWIPAKQRGQFVRVLFTIPISLAGN